MSIKQKLARDLILIATAAALLAYAIWFTDSKLARAQPLTLGPQIFTLTIGTGATLAAVPANPNVRSLVICNGNATAANVITVTFGTVITPVDGTTGLVIPGGNAVASCWYSPLNGLQTNQFWGMAQINMIGHVSSIPVTVLEF